MTLIQSDLIPENIPSPPRTPSPYPPREKHVPRAITEESTNSCGTEGMKFNSSRKTQIIMPLQALIYRSLIVLEKHKIPGNLNQNLSATPCDLLGHHTIPFSARKNTFMSALFLGQTSSDCTQIDEYR